MVTKLEFSNRGRRLKAGYGLSYNSTCGRYRVYKSDQVAGVRVRPVRWLAIEVLASGQRIISRHKKRETAVEACNKQARNAT